VRSARYHHGDINLIFGVSSSVELKRVRSKGQVFTLSELESRLKLGDVYYDIGANIGIFTLPAAKIVGCEGRVVAFEAAPANYSRLMDNLERNDLSNVTVFGLGLASETATASLYRPTDRLGEGGHSLVPLPQRGAGVSNILVARLDDLVKLWNLPMPNLIKIDVEDAEVEVLRGMPELLKNPALHSIVCETMTAQPGNSSALVTDKKVSGILSEFDFREVRRAPAGTGGHYDILFVR